METGGGEGRALVRASSNAGKLTSGGRRQLAMKMLTKVGEILEKYIGNHTKGTCIIVYNKYIPLNIYICATIIYKHF